MKNADFLIVGAGVIGLSTAWQLAKAGASVTVVDRKEPGREASWAGGGILFPIRPWDYPDAVTSLTELGRTLYSDWTQELSAASQSDPEYWETGLLTLPPMDLERAKAWCSAHRLRAEIFDPRDISPSVAAHGQSALWLPEVAQVRNPRLIKSLVRALRARGVAICSNTDVVNVTIDNYRVAGVLTTEGNLAADTIIICAGAWSSNLLGPHTEAADIFPVRGQMLLYKTAPRILDTMILKEDRYIVPRIDGHILVGSTMEQTGFKNETTPAAAAELHAFAGTIVPHLAKLRPVGHWAGLRPGSPENIPVIGRHPVIENLYLNSGHFRYGLTMAPAAAHILANLVLCKRQLLDIAPYAWPQTSLNGK